MIRITMSKKDDITKLIWCGEMFEKNSFYFEEPMQLTFFNSFNRFLYAAVWGE